MIIGSIDSVWYATASGRHGTVRKRLCHMRQFISNGMVMRVLLLASGTARDFGADDLVVECNRIERCHRRVGRPGIAAPGGFGRTHGKVTLHVVRVYVKRNRSLT